VAPVAPDNVVVDVVASATASVLRPPQAHRGDISHFDIVDRDDDPGASGVRECRLSGLSRQVADHEKVACAALSNVTFEPLSDFALHDMERGWRWSFAGQTPMPRVPYRSAVGRRPAHLLPA